MLAKNPLRVALIGVTGYGKMHFERLEQLEQRGDVRLQAVAVINRPEVEELCQTLERRGCRVYPDYESLLKGEEGQLDLCCIPTGIAWHCRMTVDALRAGCHVLVEKPVAGTLAEVDEMIRVKNETGRMVFVGFQDMFTHYVSELKHRLTEGVIGAVESVHVWASWPRTRAYYERNNWAGRLKTGTGWVYDSPANNALAHYLMAALYFAGKGEDQVASPVTLEAELYRAQPIESFDTISSCFETEDGVRIYFGVTHSAFDRIGPEIEIRCRGGKATWDCVSKITIEADNGERWEYVKEQCSRMEMFENVLASLRAGEPVGGCSLEMAREHTRLINALHEHVPITQVAGDVLEKRAAEDGTEQIAIQGVVDALRDSIGTGKPLSSMGLSWTQKQATHVKLSEELTAGRS